LRLKDTEKNRMTENPKINSNKASEVASEGLTQHELDTCEAPVEKSEELTLKEQQEVVGGFARAIGGKPMKYMVAVGTTLASGPPARIRTGRTTACGSYLG
jgi:hypothetical protein